MAEAAAAAPEGTTKMTMVAGVDESEHSFYALQWALTHFFAPGQAQQYRLVVVTAKPSAASAVGLAGPGAADVLPFVEADLKRTALRVIDKAKELCAQARTHYCERRRVRGAGGGRQERALRRRREAPRRDARRRQPRIRGHQEGCSWKRERLLRPSCPLHRNDSEEAKAQALINATI
ncbi:unnamed protein product [Urochloa decumbens]|uniref:UspA domain-containing protein n=1 Tax=Urochloa decumbens TaxID=240449 RepID=A0ABC9GD84_9POAL